MKVRSWGSWVALVLAVLYFFVPLGATLEFSLRARRGVYSLDAYGAVLADPQFRNTFLYSSVLAVATIVVSILLIVPTAYWVYLKLPRARPVVEFITLLPFVVPPIVMVFGLIKLYSREPLNLVRYPALLVGAYVILSFPYMYRAVDAGLRAMDVRSLTEAAQSLGASWPTILFRIILPNLRISLLSGAFLTFAIVIGEFTFASLLSWPTFAPYMVDQVQTRTYEPAALTIISFALIWMCIGVIHLLSRGLPEQGELAGTR